MLSYFFPLKKIKLSEVVIFSADDWVCIFVLFVVWMKDCTQGSTGGWVLVGLVFK